MAFTVLVFSLAAIPVLADSYNFGTFTYDLSNPTGSTTGSTQFDIQNLTGPLNDLPPDFPIATDMTISNLLLAVTFADGSTRDYAPTQQFLSSDQITQAVLTGTFDQTTITLDGVAGPVTILADFSAIILPGDPDVDAYLAAGQDLSVITALGTSGPVPEPGSAVLLCAGLAVAVARLRRC
jgi:hypothetical protein